MPKDAPTLLYVGIKHAVVALDAASGQIVWQTTLKGSFSANFVTLLVDATRVYAANSGELFCLDARTGAVLWHNEMKGYGVDLASLAVAHASSHTAPIAAAVAAEQAAAGAAAAAS